MARRGKKALESAYLNDRSFIYYFNRLKSLAISMFKWEGLPDTVDDRYLELALFNRGMAVFFEDEVVGPLCLNTMIGGRLDVYDIPIERTAYATNGYNMPLNNGNSVLIFNDMLHLNSVETITYFARKLYEVDRTQDVNVKGQKTPVAILCDENQRLTMTNLYLQYDGNQPFIFGDKNLDLKQITAIQTGAPYISDKLQDLKNAIWNDALNYLGISNANTDKKERLISSEVSYGMGSTFSSRFSRLSERERACEKINRMFGLDISVEYRKDVADMAKCEEIQPPGQPMEDEAGGENNE